MTVDRCQLLLRSIDDFGVTAGLGAACFSRCSLTPAARHPLRVTRAVHALPVLRACRFTTVATVRQVKANPIRPALGDAGRSAVHHGDQGGQILEPRAVQADGG